jgi:hypothetical protein
MTPNYDARERANKVYESELFARHAKMAALLLSKTDESAESINKAMEAAEQDLQLARSQSPARTAPQQQAPLSTDGMTAAQWDSMMMMQQGRDTGMRLTHGEPLPLLPDVCRDDQKQAEGAAVGRMLLSKLGTLPSGGVGSREAA